MRYFIQPGDDIIISTTVLSLEELKHLHSYAQTQQEVNDKAGFIVKSNSDMLKKLSELIELLQIQHYRTL